MTRDLIGYGATSPDTRWPGGAAVAADPRPPDAGWARLCVTIAKRNAGNVRRRQGRGLTGIALRM